MKTPIRTLMWQNPIVVERYGKKYRTPQPMTDADVDHLNKFYHILVNDTLQSRYDWYVVVLKAIRQLEIHGLDWWYADSTFIFTHEHDKALVYLTIK